MLSSMSGISTFLPKDADMMLARYIRAKRARLLPECEERLEDCRSRIIEQEQRLERIRSKMHAIDKEVAESGSNNSKIRDNLRIREMRKEILKIQEKIEGFDLEEAAKARRQFDAKYASERKRESDMESEVRCFCVTGRIRLSNQCSIPDSGVKSVLFVTSWICCRRTSTTLRTSTSVTQTN